MSGLLAYRTTDIYYTGILERTSVRTYRTFEKIESKKVYGVFLVPHSREQTPCIYCAAGCVDGMAKLIVCRSKLYTVKSWWFKTPNSTRSGVSKLQKRSFDMFWGFGGVSKHQKAAVEFQRSRNTTNGVLNHHCHFVEFWNTIWCFESPFMVSKHHGVSRCFKTPQVVFRNTTSRVGRTIWFESYIAQIDMGFQNTTVFQNTAASRISRRCSLNSCTRSHNRNLRSAPRTLSIDL